MTEKVDVVFRLRAAQSVRAIQRDTGVHRAIIRQLRELAQSRGWLSQGVPPPDEEEVARVLAYDRSSPREISHPLDAFRNDIERWIGEGNS